MSAHPPIRRALISTSDKSGVVAFARQLAVLNVELIATGGTAALLKQHQLPVKEIEEVTGFPEILGGRVKSLHPKIYAGILARRDVDEPILEKLDIRSIDLVVVNLYPFAKVTQQANCDINTAIEHIDIGGPTLLRAGAKNYASVTVIVNPDDYKNVLTQLQHNNGQTNLATRLQLAQKAFAHVAEYDQRIANYLKNAVTAPCTSSNNDETSASSSWPPIYAPQFKKKMILRYGENPQQAAAFYSDSSTGGLANAQLHQGKPLSFNNLLDSHSALACLAEFDETACVIIKHMTPCGVATHPDQQQAYLRALATDPVSAFGGIIALNSTLTTKTAASILQRQFVEVILAPSIDPEALTLLASKPNLRVLSVTPATDKNWSLRSISGGLLVQQPDQNPLDLSQLQTVSKRSPSNSETTDLLFAWRIVKHVKSNAIVYAKEQTTFGIGSGQTSRVFSAEIAILKAQRAKLNLAGAVMASDAFFPFADSVEVAAKAGIHCIIQPGGSKRDKEVIAAANAANIAMVFTHKRHFCH